MKQKITVFGSFVVDLMTRSPRLPVAGETVKGVVRSEAARQRAVDKILGFCAQELALESLGVLPAAIKGPKGNQEYMALFRRS